MITAWLLSLLALPVASQDTHYRDSLRQHIFEKGFAQINCYQSYPIGDSIVYSDFGNNAAEFESLRNFLRYAVEDTMVCVRHIKLTGYCSIDGAQQTNDRLAANRTNQVVKFLESRYRISEKCPVEITNVGADWQTFRRLIAQSKYRWKKDALAIIDATYLNERKKLRLAALDSGRAHKVIYELYPQLRRVEIKIQYDVQCMKGRIAQAQLPSPTAYSIPSTELTPWKFPLLKPYCPLFAVKTNLLCDLALMPNIEIEVPLGRRWSVNGEYMFPWWLADDRGYCLQLLSGGIEGRYWFGNRFHHRPLTGHFAGAYVGAGKYDLQWKENGYQGEFFIAGGVSYGYSLPLSRYWNMEFSLGIGLMRTNYRNYFTRDNYQTLVWKNNGTYTWFGPTKAKITLVWLIGSRKGEVK